MARWTWKGVGTHVTHRVPEAYLRAEIASFPLTSEYAFRESLLLLDPRMVPGEATHELWRHCETILAPHTGSSLERLHAARDQSWFGEPRHARPNSMYDYLARLARGRLMRQSGITHVEQSTDVTAVDAAGDYRWLTFALPEDLLLSSLGVDPAPLRVDMDPPLLIRRLLDAGVAEIHQHIGAGMGFRLLWVSALAALARPDVREDELASAGAAFGDGRTLVRWLLAAAISRYVLAEFLNRREGELQSFLTNSLSRRRGWSISRAVLLVDTLEAIASGNDSCLPDVELLRDLYAELHPTARILARDHPVRDVIDAYRRCDPIAVRFHLTGENCGERWFLERSFSYLRENTQRDEDSSSRSLPRSGSHDILFARVFWQTVRLRCHYFRTVVERPLTGGLQWFIRFYDRLGRLRDPLYPIFPEASYLTAAEGKQISALEVRTHPARTAVELASNSLVFLDSWKHVIKSCAPGGLQPEFGLVLHFVKQRHESFGRERSLGVSPAFGAGSVAEPGGRDSELIGGGRFANYFFQQCLPARAIADLIEAEPRCLWFIRGLDVANDELAVPTWVLAPIIRYLLDESARHSVRPGAGPPLRVTGHVGEDFRHLMEGMRRIYEQVHYVNGANSGRLGHALALGVEPRTWAESTGSVLMPAEDRLWDLVWEWRLYTQYRVHPEFAATAPPGRIEVLVNHFLRLGQLIYPKNHLGIECFAEAHHWLHRFAVPPFYPGVPISCEPNFFLSAARSIRSYRGRHVNWPRKVGALLEVYLSDEEAFQRGQTLIDVRIGSDEVDALMAVQHALRCGVAHKGIVVEINPSSNLLIGDMADLRNHPVLRLSPPIPEESGPPPVAIAIGSDDPVTFNTHLTREYTVMHETARAAGYAERDVQAWLETIRRTSMDARFTVSWNRETLEDIMRGLRGFLHRRHAGP